MSATGARGSHLPIHRAGCVVNHPAGRHRPGQRRHRGGIAGDPGENLGSVIRRAYTLLGVKALPRERPPDARVMAQLCKQGLSRGK